MKNVGERTSFDDMVDALAEIQRRQLLVALLEHNPRYDTPVVVADADAESDAFRRHISMRHIHVPKLVDHGFIDWNEDTNEVLKGPNFDEIRPLLELLDNHEDELPADWL